jgi:hypothetical protein
MTKFAKITLGVFAFVAVFAASKAFAYTFNMNLSMGMTNADVVELQKALNMSADTMVASTGAGSPGMETMYFGGMTKAAVVKMQAKNGLPQTGFVGPMTRAILNGGTSGTGSTGSTGALCPNGMTLASNCTTGATTGGSTSTGSLQGGAGDITLSALSTYSAEEVGEADEDVKIMAFEVEADDESDVDVTSVKVEFFQDTGADSDKLDDYASSVSIWLDGDKVGEADAEDFSESSDYYSKSIALNGAVVDAGETAEFIVAISSLDNLDSGDIDTDDWSVDLLSVRFEDAEGVVTTESGSASGTDGAGAFEKNFDFASFATANSVDMKVSLNDDEDDINDAHVVDIDTDTDTDDVEILAFTIEADGDSDLNISEIPATITTTGEADEAVLVQNAQLWYDGESIASDTIPTGGAVVFEDLDIDIESGEMAEFTITVDIQDTDGVADNGDTVQASLTTQNVDDIEAEDETGEEVVDGDASGSAVADAHGVYDVGIMAEFVSSTAVAMQSGVADVDDQGMFTIVFDVTAFDSDIYVDGTAVADEAGGATYQDIVADNIVATGVIDCASCDDGANTTFKVDEGTTERFTITISGPAAADVFAKASLESILYAVTAIDGDVVYNFNMGEFTTDNVFLNDNA